MAKTIHINSTQQFDSYLSNTEYVIVDFHATWCGPCHAIAPVFEKLANQHSTPGGFAFVKVDVDQQPELAGRYCITAMPTFLIIKGRNVTQTIRGANPPALTAAVESVAKALAAESAKAAQKKDEPKTEENPNEETVSGSYGMSKGIGWKMSLN